MPKHGFVPAPAIAAATSEFVPEGESIQDALDSLGGGGQVLVGPGTFAENVVVGADQDLIGSGAETEIAPASGTGIQVTSGTRARVSNLQVTGGATSLRLDGASQAAFDNLWLINPSGDGIYIDGDDPTETFFNNINVRQFGGVGVHYVRTNTTDSGGVYFHQVLATQPDAGAKCWRFVKASGAACKAYAWLNQCVADGFTVAGVEVDNIDDVRARQLWAVGTSPSAACLRLDDAHQLDIDARCYQNSATGYAVEFDGTSQYVKLRGDYDGLGIGYKFTGTGHNDLDLDDAKNVSATKTSGTTNTRSGVDTRNGTPWQGFFNPNPTANRLYYHAVPVRQFQKLTGISFYVDTTTTGNVIVALYDAAGNKVAESASTALGGSFSQQAVPFTSPYMAVPGKYFVALIPSTGTTLKFGCAWPQGAAGGATQGGFSAPSTITPPAVSSSAQVPTMSTY